MPKFLEQKLKKKYGANSSIPYKIMNAKGYMHGSKETSKGRAAQAKHERDYHESTKRGHTSSEAVAGAMAKSRKRRK